MYTEESETKKNNNSVDIHFTSDDFYIFMFNTHVKYFQGSYCISVMYCSV